MKKNYLTNWRITYDRGYCLTGILYKDKRHRFNDGELIITSRLKHIDFDKLKAKTKNATYNLEKQDYSAPPNKQ